MKSRSKINRNNIKKIHSIISNLHLTTTKGTKVTTSLCRRAIRVFWSKIFKRCLTRNYLFAVTWKMMKKMNKLLSRVFQSFFFNRSLTLKFWQNKKDRNLFEMPTKNDVFFSAASCKKDTIFGGHPKQIFGPSYFVRVLDYRDIIHDSFMIHST